MKRRSFLCLMALITVLSAASVMASPVDNTLAEDGWTGVKVFDVDILCINVLI